MNGVLLDKIVIYTLYRFLIFGGFWVDFEW